MMDNGVTEQGNDVAAEVSQVEETPQASAEQTPADKKELATSSHNHIHCGVWSVQGQRNEMEDEHTSYIDFQYRSTAVSIFGVYDGHSGTGASQYLRDELPKLVCQYLQDQTPSQALTSAVLEAENGFREFCKRNNCDSGSTLAIIVIIGDILVCANVGDSESLLCTGESVICLSEIHNMYKNPEEEVRVKQCGGTVWRKRLGHPCFNPSIVSLAVTRSIGDDFFKQGAHTEQKPSGLIANPFVHERRLTPDDKFMVIACDGLFDVMGHEEVGAFITRNLEEGNTPQVVAEMLVNQALDKGSTDNITVLIVTLKPHVCWCQGSGEEQRKCPCFHSKNHKNQFVLPPHVPPHVTPIPQSPATDDTDSKLDEDEYDGFPTAGDAA